mgnify:FL=1
MRGFKWRDGDFEDDESPDEGYTKRLYDAFSYLRKKTIYQKIWMSVCLGLLGLCAYLVIFPIFPNPPIKLIFLSLIHFMITVHYFRKTIKIKKECEFIRDEDLKKYDDDGRFT